MYSFLNVFLCSTNQSSWSTPFVCQQQKSITQDMVRIWSWSSVDSQIKNLNKKTQKRSKLILWPNNCSFVFCSPLCFHYFGLDILYLAKYLSTDFQHLQMCTYFLCTARSIFPAYFRQNILKEVLNGTMKFTPKKHIVPRYWQHLEMS